MVYSFQKPERGQIVCAMVAETTFNEDQTFNKGRPKQIKFISLLPYNGFQYIEIDEEIKEGVIKSGGYNIPFDEITKPDGSRGEIKESGTTAIFADTKEELVQYYVSKVKKQIDELEGEIKRLKSF